METRTKRNEIIMTAPLPSSTMQHNNDEGYYMDYMLNQTAGGDDSLLLSPTIADYLPSSTVGSELGVNLQQEMLYEEEEGEDDDELGASIIVDDGVEDEFCVGGIGMPLNVIQEEDGVLSSSGSSDENGHGDLSQNSQSNAYDDHQMKEEQIESKNDLCQVGSDKKSLSSSSSYYHETTFSNNQESEGNDSDHIRASIEMKQKLKHINAKENKKTTARVRVYKSEEANEKHEENSDQLANKSEIIKEVLSTPKSKHNVPAPSLSPLISPIQRIQSRQRRRRATIAASEKRSSSIGTAVEQTKTPPVKDLRSAQKAVNFNSSTLVARLEAAGKKRILHLSRRRDSLAAKVQVHSQKKTSTTDATLAPEENVAQQKEVSQLQKTRVEWSQLQGNNPYKPFSARPVPDFVQPGYGGQVGVPRVEKKLPTTPASPKLGPRRMSDDSRVHSLAMKKVRARMIKDREMKNTISRRFSMPPPPSSRSIIPERPMLSPKSNPYRPFVARSIPATSLDTINYGGQYGIPKADKREPTIPESPQITKVLSKSNKLKEPNCDFSHMARSRDYPRPHRKSEPIARFKPFKTIKSGREASDEIERCRKEKLEQEEDEAKRLSSSFRARPLPLSNVVAPSSTLRRNNNYRNNPESPLIGLNILADENSVTSSIEILDESGSTNHPQTGSPPSLLHSSLRARGRAAFEKRKLGLREEKLTEKENRLSQLAHRLSIERGSLRESIR